MTTIRKIILATMVLMLLSSVGYGADWKYLCKGEGGDNWFYDTQSIYRGQETVKVWVKDELSDGRKEDYIKLIPKAPGIENISYVLSSLEYDCSKNAKRTFSIALYDSKDGIILSEDCPDPNPKFQGLKPNSVDAQLVEIICKREGKKGGQRN